MVTLAAICFLCTASQESSVIGWAYPEKGGRLLRPGLEARAAKSVEQLRGGYSLSFDKGQGAKIQLKNGALRYMVEGPGTFMIGAELIKRIAGTGAMRKLDGIAIPPPSPKLKNSGTAGKPLRFGGPRVRGGDDLVFGPGGRLLEPVLTLRWKADIKAAKAVVSVRSIDPDPAVEASDIWAKIVDFSPLGSVEPDLKKLKRGEPYLVTIRFENETGETVAGVSREIQICSDDDLALLRAERETFAKIDDVYEREMSWMQRCLSYGLYAEALAAIERAEKASPDSKELIAPIRSQVNDLAIGSN